MLDYLPRFGEGVAALAKARRRRAASCTRRTCSIGLENAPRTFLRLFRGENRGKQILAL